MIGVDRAVALWAAVLWAGHALPAHAEDLHRAVFESEARLRESVRLVEAAVPYAHLRVSKGDRDGVWARARVEMHHPVEGRAEEILREWGRMELVREGETARLVVEALPSGELSGVDARWSIAAEVEIEIPDGVAVSLTCWYGSVEIVHVTGPISVEVTSGEATLRGAPGDAVVSATFGAVTVEGGGHVSISGSSTDITVRGVKSAHIKSRFGTVAAADVTGGLQVDGSSTAISVDGVAGAIEVDNVFGPVSIRGPRGGVRVKTSDAITVMGIGEIPVGSQWRLETQSAPVELTLPASVQAEVRAFSHLGPIDSDFPMLLKHGWDEEATIRLGDARGTEIEIRSAGPIRVLREADSE